MKGSPIPQINGHRFAVKPRASTVLFEHRAALLKIQEALSAALSVVEQLEYEAIEKEAG